MSLGSSAAKPLPPTPPEGFSEREFWCWLGGFVDGEGYIGWDGSARVVLTGTCKPVLEWIQAELEGGTLRILTSRGRLSVKPAYQLTFCGPSARRLLFRLRLFLFEKRAQADLVLSCPPAEPGKQLAPGEHDRRLDIRKQLRELRHREYR